MDVTYETLAEGDWLLTLGNDVSVRVNARVHALASALREAHIDGLQDIVPAYTSLLLRHDFTDAKAISRWRQRVRDVVSAVPGDADPPKGQLHDVPVCYGGEYGVDLNAVAKRCELTQQEVIERHAAVEYRVAMIGFAPGFPYLIGMDARLATPRHDTPRTRVPAGSVAIAGNQTGIYPAELPGGWQLIGRTPVGLFEPNRQNHVCRMAPGDRVRFRSVDCAAFVELERQGCRW